MAQSDQRDATANITITEPVRDWLRVKKAERGITYDQLLRDELEYDHETNEITEETE